MLVDQYGQAVSTRLLNGAERWPRSRPHWPVRAEDSRKAIDLTDWLTVLSVSRRLFANNGILKGAIAQKAMHSVGRAWEPEFQGEDKAWGDAATAWLRDEWFQLCDVRGEAFDFKTGLYLDSVSIDRDGDVGVMLTETEDGYPQVQRVPAHRIGQRDSGNDVVKEGPYRGLRISHGVIFNKKGRAVAFRFLGDTEDKDEDVSARDLMMIFDPEYADQVRGLPIFSHALNDIRDADQSQQWEQLAQLIYSSIVLTEDNEAGAADANDPAFLLGEQSGANPTLSQEKFDGGMIRYFKAGSGGKLEAFMSSRPGDAWDSFQDRIARKALLGIGWPYSLCWKPDGMNGTQERSEIEKARTAIKDRQDLLAPRAKRICGYAISKAIKLGILPPYTGADKGGFLKWAFTMPPQFSIDHGRDGNSRREDYKLGHKNLSEILAEQGKSYAEHMARREMETDDLLRRASALSSRHGITMEAALNLLSERNNQSLGQPQAVPPVDNSQPA